MVGEDYERISAEFTYTSGFRLTGPDPGTIGAEMTRFVDLSEFLDAIEAKVKFRLGKEGYAQTVESLVDKDCYETSGTLTYLASQAENWNDITPHPIPISDLVCCLIHIRHARLLVQEKDVEGAAAVCFHLGRSAELAG